MQFKKKVAAIGWNLVAKRTSSGDRELKRVHQWLSKCGPWARRQRGLERVRQAEWRPALCVTSPRSLGCVPEPKTAGLCHSRTAGCSDAAGGPGRPSGVGDMNGKLLLMEELSLGEGTMLEAGLTQKTGLVLICELDIGI